MNHKAEAIDRMWDEHMHTHYEAVRSPHASLNEALDKMAKTLGVETPRLYIAKQFPAIFGGEAPNMLASMTTNKELGGAVVMTRSYLDMFKFNAHSGHVPAEIRASLGHELGHFKQGAAYISAVQKYPLILGPVAAMAGLYLYDKVAGKKAPGAPEPSKEALLQAMDMQAQQDIHHIEQKHAGACALCPEESPAREISRSVKTTQQQILEAGRYAAAGAVGLVAGAQVTRQAMLQLEFEADKIGAELSGDPQAMINSLNTFHDYLRKMPKEKRIAQMNQISFSDAISAYIYHAHPTLAERVERLEAMIEKPAAACIAHATKLMTTHFPVL